MPDRSDEVALGVASIQDTLRSHSTNFTDVLDALQAVIAGQGRVAELLGMINRQLVALNKAVAQEPDGENLAEMIRTMLVQLSALLHQLPNLAHQVAAEVVLDTTGVTLPSPRR